MLSHCKGGGSAIVAGMTPHITTDAVAGRGETVDLLIVGAGFAGLFMLQRARSLGLRARVFEAAAGVGGTWFWNRYPGARCDVQSLEYSYQFDEALQQQWQWSERYASQPEILRYAEHVADRFDLRRDMRFCTRVVAAHWQHGAGLWQVQADGGIRIDARFLVMATGCLSSAQTPQIAGLESFAGRVLHTGRWPHEPVDFAGQRVGVIGTGSSVIQAIPLIAGQARQLTVLQRTATYSVPAVNAPLDRAYEARIKADYAGFRARNSQMLGAFGADFPRREDSALLADAAELQRRFDERWKHGGLVFTGAFGDLMLDERANRLAADYVRRRIRQRVHDPALAERLSPSQPIGCKRLCLDSGYYETYNRANVELIDIGATPIERIGADALHVGSRRIQIDTLVLATGFDAMTGALLKIDIRGRDAFSLRDKWRAGPSNYLGLGVAGFPNLFTITGPGSPSVLTNMMVSIEQHVNWIAECLDQLRRRGLRTIEARPGAETAWVRHVNAVAERTLFPRCNSWYLGANVPGKPRVFMPLLGFPAYAKHCAEVAAQGYPGFALA
jgi:cyclohexanone monooxygenase